MAEARGAKAGLRTLRGGELLFAIAGFPVAVVATLVHQDVLSYTWIAAGFFLGKSGIRLDIARVSFSSGLTAIKSKVRVKFWINEGS